MKEIPVKWPVPVLSAEYPPSRHANNAVCCDGPVFIQNFTCCQPLLPRRSSD